MNEVQTTDLLARVRAITLLLPGAEERAGDEQTIFLVDGQAFAKVDASVARVMVRDDSGDAWVDVGLRDAPDWVLVEDRIARSWELTAPDGLLEAGGR